MSLDVVWDRGNSPWIRRYLRHPLAQKACRIFELKTSFKQKNGPARGNVALTCKFPWRLVVEGRLHLYRVEFWGNEHAMNAFFELSFAECKEAMIVRYALSEERLPLQRCDLSSPDEELLRLRGEKLMALKCAKTIRRDRLVPLVHGISS